jgi:hypothetical protein
MTFSIFLLAKNDLGKKAGDLSVIVSFYCPGPVVWQIIFSVRTKNKRLMGHKKVSYYEFRPWQSRYLSQSVKTEKDPFPVILQEEEV